MLFREYINSWKRENILPFDFDSSWYINNDIDNQLEEAIRKTNGDIEKAIPLLFK